MLTKTITMKYAICLLAILLMASCKEDAVEAIKAPLNLEATALPFAVASDVMFYQDIAYGDDPRNKFDFFSPVTTEPVPLLIYIHGGGFTSGDKAELYSSKSFSTLVGHLLSQGIAVASINYRLLMPNETEGVLKPMNDSRRALQFLRYYAEELTIQKDNVVLIGSSAGAGTSLWIGLSEDFQDLQSTDPVLRESTRVQGIAVLSTQSSYDVLEWHNSTFEEYQLQGMDDKAVFNLVGEDVILRFYGVSNVSELHSAHIEAYREKVDMLALLSNDDPELYLSSSDIAYSIPTSNDAILHHPLHAKAVYDQAISKGLVCKVHLPNMGFDNRNGEQLHEFIKRRLGK